MIDGKLKICIDFKSPYAFVAHQFIWSIETEYGYEIDWLPLTLNIGSFLGTATKQAGGQVSASNRSPQQWSVVKEAYRDARRYAEHQGLTLKGPLKVWDSSFASMALIWSQSKAPTRHHLQRFMTTLFQRFWIRDFDLQDVQALCALMQASAIESDGFNRFCAEEGRQQHDALQEQLLAQGVYGVPTFLIDDEVFFGREQIDTVLWRLQGSVGPMPLLRYPWGDKGSAAI